MKKLVLSLALLMAASVCMAQSAEDKAKAKAEAAALKAAQKEARAQFNEARNMMDALNMKLADKEKPLSAEEVMEESKKGQQTIAAAIASGHLQTDKLGEAYKVSSFFANNINNLLIASAGNKEPFDTLAFLPNLIQLTDALAGELQYTKVVKG